jgi:hypothetical protein
MGLSRRLVRGENKQAMSGSPVELNRVPRVIGASRILTEDHQSATQSCECVLEMRRSMLGVRLPTTEGRALMRIGAVILLVWLVIGAIAGGQRGYYSNGSSDTSCAKAGTIAVTIVSGPLNYVGVNPKIHCKVPQPSK